MKKVLKVLLLGLILVALLFSIVIIVNIEDKKESVETDQTRTMIAKTITKDWSMIDFYVMYEGSFPEYSDHAIESIVRQIVLKKNVLEILKHNSLEFIEDTLECKITPIDSTFNVLSIETKYYLQPEVQELWDEYMAKKIKEAKAIEKARNLKILYGE